MLRRNLNWLLNANHPDREHRPLMIDQPSKCQRLFVGLALREEQERATVILGRLDALQGLKPPLVCG